MRTRNFHAACRHWLERQRMRPDAWYTTWAILYEFLRVTTHARVMRRPWSAPAAWNFVAALLASPGLAVLVPTEWEVLRWRRLKGSLIRARGVKALEDFVYDQLDENDDYELYSEQFANRLAEILQHNLPEDQAEDAQRLAHKYAENEPEAVDKVDEILAGNRMDMDHILRDARRVKAKELVHGYAQHEPAAVTLVDELLGSAGTSIEALTADALKEEFDYIERIDRLTAIAEDRRNGCLNEIERRRLVFGQTLRRTVQEIEEDEVEMIEAPAKGKNAA
jgi:hypothetical protein